MIPLYITGGLALLKFVLSLKNKKGESDHTKELETKIDDLEKLLKK